MRPSPTATHQPLAVEAELADGPVRFVRERLRLPLGREASFGWLRHPPSVMVVPRLADGRLLLARRWRPAVGRWVLEFPAGPLAPEEAPARGASRLLRDLLGRGDGQWHPLGELRPNPGYSDERMAIGWLALERDAALELDATAPTAVGGLTPAEEATTRRWLCAPAALDAAFSNLAEPVDGRSVSAWFLARRGGIG
ncbi:MAG: NUDIX hydrolase [Cyanobacteria bacterium K_Offshore_surface_m2_239]|nr:NUDIX hydrolase [Cyanobacteria bacterium K_Offshore_surface_m2_239]